MGNFAEIIWLQDFPETLAQIDIKLFQKLRGNVLIIIITTTTRKRIYVFLFNEGEDTSLLFSKIYSKGRTFWKTEIRLRNMI